MSIGFPEAQILAEQMNKALLGKQVLTCDLRNCERLQRVGFVTKDPSSFAQIVGGTIESVVSRGNVIRVKLNKGMNLILAPEYGGKILLHAKNSVTPEKFHLKLSFADDTALTVALSGMEVI